MIYQWHQMQQSAMTPFRIAGQASAQAFRNPWNILSWTPGARAATAAWDVLDDATHFRSRPQFGIAATAIDGETFAISEQVVAEKPFCELRRFARVGAENRNDPRLLIVAPLSGHFATLLRGTVERMLPDHDVYITDWRDAREVPLAAGSFDFDDYIDYVTDFLHAIGPGTHVLAVCQPAAPVLAAIALMAQSGDKCVPSSMILMGGPVDSRINPTVPNRLAQERSLDWFEQTVITRVPLPHAGFMRRVYPGFLQLAGFITMNLDRHVGAQIKFFRHLVRGDGDSAQGHREFYDEYRAVMDLPAEYYLQTVKQVFQEHQLPLGVMQSRGQLVEPRAITKTALMTVEGERDDISGLGQTHAAHALCAGIPAARRAHYVQPGVGHFGVFNGKRWREDIAPRIGAFIRANDRR
jgi:poly(3-hydroxybutyrate) depolymerase